MISQQTEGKPLKRVYDGPRSDVTAAMFEAMYREYRRTGTVSNYLEATEVEGKMTITKFRTLNGIFYENGILLIDGGEIRRYKNENGKKYVEISAFEELVDAEEFYSYLYPFVCNEVYEIVVNGNTVKVVDESTLKIGAEKFKERITKASSKKSTDLIVKLLELEGEEFEVAQRKVFMESIKVGDSYVGRIKRVFEKYVVLGLTGNERVELFLHVSKMRDAFIKDATKIMYVGQEFQVKVVHVGENKIEVSSVGYPLCQEEVKYYNEKGEWMSMLLLEQAVNREKTKKLANATFKNSTVEIDNKETVVNVPKQNVPKQNVTMQSVDNEVAEYIQVKTGELSEPAQQKLKEMIDKYGLFKMGVAVEKTINNFNIDKGLILMNETERLLQN